MIIVFGAAGFIGTYLVSQLVKDVSDVLASDISDLSELYYSKQQIRYMKLDITDRAAFDRLPKQGVDAIINLACVQPANVSEEQYDPVDYIRVNVIGTLNILDYCRNAKVPKIIYTCSHRNTQGLWKDKKIISESDGRSIKYTGDYAMFSISESAASDCVEHYAQVYGMQGIVLRLPPVYGYGPHTIIFKDGKPLKTGFQFFIENASAGKPLEVWGDSGSGRDIVYVKDVVTAIGLALKNNNVSGLYNISSGRLLSLKEQAEIIAKVFGPSNAAPKIVYWPDKLNSIENYVYDIQKAKRELGWSPRYSFEDMLIDYKKEMESGRFDFLVEKRKQMMRSQAKTI